MDYYEIFIFICLYLSLSNGEEYITSAQLEKRMKELWDMRLNNDDSSSGEDNEDSEKDNSDSQKDGNGSGSAALESPPPNHIVSEGQNNSLSADKKNHELQEGLWR